MIKHGHSAVQGRENNPVTHPASGSRGHQRSPNCQHRDTPCQHRAGNPPRVPAPGVPPASQRDRNSPFDGLQPGLSISRGPGMLLGRMQAPAALCSQHGPRRWEDGGGAQHTSRARAGAALELPSPRLTQICLKGSGAAALSLQARLGRFQGTPSLRSKLAAKNGTPLWQGDMLLVLAGGQGTARAPREGGLDSSADRGGCAQTCHTAGDKKLSRCWDTGACTSSCRHSPGTTQELLPANPPSPEPLGTRSEHPQTSYSGWEKRTELPGTPGWLLAAFPNHPGWKLHTSPLLDRHTHITADYKSSAQSTPCCFGLQHISPSNCLLTL